VGITGNDKGVEVVALRCAVEEDVGFADDQHSDQHSIVGTHIDRLSIDI
jgi:hypothetical protein